VSGVDDTAIIGSTGVRRASGGTDATTSKVESSAEAIGEGEADRD
jgi:hypothetical protein